MYFVNIMMNIGICFGNFICFIFRYSIFKEVVVIMDIVEILVIIIGRNFLKFFYIVIIMFFGYYIICFIIVICYICFIIIMWRKIVLIFCYGISGKVIYCLKVDFWCDRRKRFFIKKVIIGCECYYFFCNKICLYK